VWVLLTTTHPTNVSINLQEIAMTRLMVFLTALPMTGAAHAMEVQDAPVADPNYFGIAIFLLLFFGGSAWFMWRLMHRGKKDHHNKGRHAE
jgi:peptidoglycan/LPS O-acetylase OafA/YrhL